MKLKFKLSVATVALGAAFAGSAMADTKAAMMAMAATKPLVLSAAMQGK